MVKVSFLGLVCKCQDNMIYVLYVYRYIWNGVGHGWY